MTAAPPLPADVDLRGLGWMPLMGDRLFASQTWIRASDAGKIAALKLWWHSFSKEIPASSLPSDDTLLASYAGLTIRKFRLMREEVMRGWIECNDGRLYHPIVAELAIDAWEKRQKYTSSRERDRNRLAEWRARQREQPAEDETRFSAVTTHVTKRERNADETHRDRTGHNKTEDTPLYPPVVKRVSAGRIESDWQPSREALEWAAENFQLTPERATQITAEFVDYWLAQAGKSAARASWDATWRNRVRQLAEHNRLSPSNGANGKNHKSEPGALPPPEPWEQRIRMYRERKFWNNFWGPRPDEPGCYAPAHLLQ